MLLHLQVYTGARRSNAITSADLSSLSIDDLVAVYCANYDREPVIGRCTQIWSEEIEVPWMEGTYTSSWRPWKVRDQQNRRKVIDWTDNIPKGSIILFGFSLTARNHLRKNTSERLKEEYGKLK